MLCCVRARTGSRLRRQPMAVSCGPLTERASCGGRLCAAARAAPLGAAWRARTRRASLARSSGSAGGRAARGFASRPTDARGCASSSPSPAPSAPLPLPSAPLRCPSSALCTCPARRPALRPPGRPLRLALVPLALRRAGLGPACRSCPAPRCCCSGCSGAPPSPPPFPYAPLRSHMPACSSVRVAPSRLGSGSGSGSGGSAGLQALPVLCFSSMRTCSVQSNTLPLPAPRKHPPPLRLSSLSLGWGPSRTARPAAIWRRDVGMGRIWSYGRAAGVLANEDRVGREGSSRG